MSVSVKKRIGNLEIIEVGATHLGAGAEKFLLSPELKISRGEGGALYDLSKVQTADSSGLCVLANLYALPYQVGFFGAKNAFGMMVAENGMDGLLEICPTLEKALLLDWTRKFQLSGKKVVILSAGYGTRCYPLSQDTPKPMLPLLGKPILHHIIEQLKAFGIRDIILNPGYHGTKISDYFHAGNRFSVDIEYANEGAYQDGQWVENILGSASSLRNIHEQKKGLDEDFFVLCGDGLCDIDLIAMFERHQQTGAIATIATRHVAAQACEKYGIVAHDGENRVTGFQEKPARGEAVSRLANIGAYIFSPRIFDHIPHRLGIDIGHHILPHLIEAGEYVAHYQSEAPWLDIGCGADFFRANCALLERAKAAPEAFGVQWRKNFALGAGAQLMRGANARGDVYIGEGAIVHSGARFIGPCFIGAGAVIEGRSFIENSIIMPGTHVMPDAYAVDVIAGAHWAFSHPFATKAVQNTEPLEHMCSINKGIALRYQSGLSLKSTGS